jgi:hypothetical protein
MKDSPAAAFARVPINEGISPHPVPLPMGEGTVLHAPGVMQASLLPGGEGQDEGSERSSLRDRASSAQPSLSLPANSGI